MADEADNFLLQLKEAFACLFLRSDRAAFRQIRNIATPFERFELFESRATLYHYSYEDYYYFGKMLSRVMRFF
jgi:hypothetical protein